MSDSDSDSSSEYEYESSSSESGSGDSDESETELTSSKDSSSSTRKSQDETSEGDGEFSEDAVEENVGEGGNFDFSKSIQQSKTDVWKYIIVVGLCLSTAIIGFTVGVLLVPTVKHFTGVLYAPFDWRRHSGESVIILNLYGNYKEMGYQYGELLEEELHETLDILLSYFYAKNFTYDEILEFSQFVFDNFPHHTQSFLDGIALGSDLPFPEVLILQAQQYLRNMERSKSGKIHYSTASGSGGCTYFTVPGTRTVSGKTIVGRTYDYGAPHDEISKNLVLSFINDGSSIPTATLAFPGEFFCTTCINTLGLFVEVNAAWWSGGKKMESNRESLVDSTLRAAQSCATSTDITRQFSSTKADISLIVNVCDGKTTSSFEFTDQDMHDLHTDDVFVCTNYFQSDEWESNDLANEGGYENAELRLENTVGWLDVEGDDVLDVDDVMKFMEMSLEDGGPNIPATLFQMVYDYETELLWVRNPKHNDEDEEGDSGWEKIDLEDYFEENYDEIN